MRSCHQVLVNKRKCDDVCTCAVSGQWLLSVYEVLVAQIYGPVLPDPVRLRTRLVELADLNFTL